MSSSKQRINEVVNLIRALKDDNDADEIIRVRTGYSKAFVSALRADMKSWIYNEEEA